MGPGVEVDLQAIPEGWRTLVASLMSDLARLGHYEVKGIKAKHGSLRFYADGLTEEQRALVRRAERKSLEMCEICGGPGGLAVMGATIPRRGSRTGTRCRMHYYEGLNHGLSR